MNDLIDRQVAIDALNKLKIYRPLDSDRYVISDCLNKIVNLPSAQPEVIRCKKCKFYTKMRTDLKTGICSLACRHLGDDGFCSEAERRSDG
jgi:hypothetical protein